MIRALVGGIGSGKSVSAARMIARRKMPTFTNFGSNLPNVTRLEIGHIMKETFVESPSGRGKPARKLSINWEFWKNALEETEGFDIILDEVHNIVNSRRAMSSFNVNMGMWLSQIRKILGSSERNDIVLITQRINRIDLTFRDLLHEIISCDKMWVTKKGRWIAGTNANKKYARLIETKTWHNGKTRMRMVPEAIIIQHHFTGDQCVQRYEAFMMGMKKMHTSRNWFKANRFMQYYDSYELIEFGDSAYL